MPHPLAPRRYRKGQRFGRHIDDSVELGGGLYTGASLWRRCWGGCLYPCCCLLLEDAGCCC